jgi:hypothetical protein
LPESVEAVSEASFIPLVRILKPLGDGCWVTACSEESLFCQGEWRLRVNEESVEFWGELNGREEEVCWQVYSSRRPVGWIILAAYVACVKGMSDWVVRNDGVQSLEDSVNRSVTAASVPPTFDNALVISVYDEILSFLTVLDETPNEAFKPDSFSPSDIPLAVEGLPAGYQTPCLPSVADGNGDANL